jgi:hypothetical protein
VANLNVWFLIGKYFIFIFSIREQITKFRREGIESTFAVEETFRSDEEARSWCPYVLAGVNEPELEIPEGELDRQTRFY